MPNDFLSKENILNEVKKLQYLYTLKKEIRYGQKRNDDDITESVAEHIYGMYILANYFLPLEDEKGEFDRTLVYEMILMHDMDEIETGDTIGYLKTDKIRAGEKLAMEIVISNSPDVMKLKMKEITDCYNEQILNEAKFVKALDRFEPLIQIYSDFGRRIHKINKPKVQDSERIKASYIKPFPIMFAYYEIIHQTMIDEGFFEN